MTQPAYTVEKISAICGGELFSDGSPGREIRDLLIDSRRLIHPEGCLFVALVTDRNDGHRYIEDLYDKGVRSFLVSALPGGRKTKEEGQGMRDAGRVTRDAGSGMMDEGGWTREVGYLTHDAGRVTLDMGQGNEGRGTRDEGRGTRG
jgi:hypothetical protein